MEVLGRRDGAECFMVDGNDDDLLNFSLDGEEEDEKTLPVLKSSSSSFSSDPLISHHDNLSGTSSFPEFVEEEELEWISNKDAFPSVETCFDMFSENPDIMGLDHQSPVSVLENSSSSSNSNGNGSGNGSTIMSCCRSIQVPTSFPVRARSKGRRSRRRTGFNDLPSQQLSWSDLVNIKKRQQELALQPLPVARKSSGNIGRRRCMHCGADNTPQWRGGPMGPKTLCNACGVRYKSGRLVPEYRPANSPTFSAALHSNSHRKVVEMRKQKQMGMGGIMANEACGYRVG